MILFINTAETHDVFLAMVEKNNVIVQKRIRTIHHRSERLLREIDVLIKKKSVSLPKIKGIVVVTGPGSFTSLRIGVAIANTLSWTLGVPIAGLSLGDVGSMDNLGSTVSRVFKKTGKKQILEPAYGSQPNITLK